MKVIYLHRPEIARFWGDAVFEVVGAKHDLTEWDRAKPLDPQFSDVEALLDLGGRAATREMFAAAPKLKLWQMICVGYDAVDLSIADGTDVAIASCPGSTSAEGLAEGAMMFMLMIAKQYRQAQRCLASGQLYSPPGEELEGKILGIIGLGASGSRLAAMAKSFGMRLMIIEPQPIEKALLDQLRPEFVGDPNDLDRVVAKADVISLHLPLTTSTRHLIDARRIDLMKPGACLINVARSGLVDEQALNRALMEGRIGGIGSDVFADVVPAPRNPVFHHDNLVAMPHIAGATYGAARRRAEVCLENLDRIARGLELLCQVQRRT